MKYLILGAGPAGLAFANRLIQKGEDSFLVLEKENEAGGLCRSKEVDGKPLDIGGGHFIDVRNKRVLDFLFEVMPREEWNFFERDSRIDLYGTIINSPIEANIWQLPIDTQVKYLKSIAIAGCNLEEAMPQKFVEWIYWKLGKKIAEEYMIPYNQKMFGNDLDVLGTYWLDKLPSVSFEETLISCLQKHAYGTQPGHAQFLYPKEYGSGEVWRRLAERIKGKIVYGVDIKSLDLHAHLVNGSYNAECIINTIPWTEFETIKGLSAECTEIIESLKYTSISVDYFEENMDSTAHWIYYPDLKLPYHRILLRSNFCTGAKGYWTETNVERIDKEKKQNQYISQYAYPLNTLGKRERMNRLLEYLRDYNIWGLGRWGEWEHYNSDVVVNKAMDLVDLLVD